MTAYDAKSELALRLRCIFASREKVKEGMLSIIPFHRLMMMMFSLKGTMSVVKLQACRERIRTELDSVVDFWLKYSHDTVHGYCSFTSMLFK